MENIIKDILKDDGRLFKVPGFLGLSTDRDTIYVLDCWKGCYGITLDSRIMFNYQKEEAGYYYGLVVDSDGLFIGVAVDNKF